MFVGPVFTVELITSARRARYFIWRVAYALVLLVILVAIYIGFFGFAETDSIKTAANFAFYFFYTYVFVQLWAVILLGPAITAGAIAQERERRTIEYLFTTHLSNAEIVLSKLTAAVVQLTTAVLVGVPILAIAMWLGGLDPEQLAAALIVTVSTIITIVALSLTASVLSRRALEAVTGAYVVLFLLLAGPSLLASTGVFGWIQSMVSAASNSGWPIARLLRFALVFEYVVDAMQATNPLEVLSRVLENSENTGALGTGGGMTDPLWRNVWGSVVTHLAFSAVCVAWSAWSLRRLHLEARVSASDEKGQNRWRLWRPKLDVRPIVWREMHARRSQSWLAILGRVLLWLGVVASVGFIVWQYAESSSANKPEEFIMFVLVFGTFLCLFALMLMAAWASNSIAAERENETWTMLISTPLLGHEIFLGKLLGSIYAARIVLLPLSALWLLALIVEPGFILALPLVIISFAVLAVSGSSLGLAMSLWCPSSTRALGITLGIVFGVSVITTCCYPLGFVNPGGLTGLLPGFVYFTNRSTQELAWLGTVASFAFWALGILLHAGAAALFWFVSVQNFDRLAGRSVIPLSGLIPMAPQTPFSLPAVPDTTAPDANAPESTAPEPAAPEPTAP